MTKEYQFPRLHGSQTLLFEENGNTLAKVSAMAQASLHGTQIKLEHAKSVSRIGLGLAITSMGLAVLSSLSDPFMEESGEIMELVENLLAELNVTDADTYPF